MAENQNSADLDNINVTPQDMASSQVEDQVAAENDPDAGQDSSTQVQGMEGPAQNDAWGDKAPPPNVKIEPVMEVPYTIRSFGFYNDKPINLMKNANLTNIDDKACAVEKLDFDYEQTSLRSDITIVHRVQLKPAAGSSSPVIHTMRTIIPAKNIGKMIWTKATAQSLPNVVKLALNGMELNYDALAFLEITASSVQMSATNIPTTLIPAAAELLNTFTSKVNLANKLGQEHKFLFIIRDTLDDDRDAVMGMAIARERNLDNDPLRLWVYNSPQKLQLGIGNIHAPPNRPPLTEQGLVLRPKRVYQDELELKVYLIYAITAENDYARACNAEWGDDFLKATFAAMPGTSFKDHDGDNDLPKQYWCHVKLSKAHQDVPDVGSWVQLDLFSFKPPPCPEGEAATEEHDSEPEDNMSDNGDDFQPFHKDGHELSQIKQEKLDEHNEELARYWRGQVVRINDGDIEVVLQRPTDPRWKGSKELKPRVNTPIPTYATNFRHMARLQDEQKKAPKHDVLMKPYYSEQGYKDLVAGIGRFTETVYTQEQIKSSVQAHLSKYLVTRDANLVLDKCDLFGEVFTKDWQKFTSNLSPHQTKAFKGLSIDHGLTVINGCVASAKTHVALIAAACAIENPKKPHKVLCTVETNFGVDSAAKALEEILSKSSKPRTIIRLLPQKAEIALVVSKVVTPKFRTNFEQSDELVASFLGEAETHLYDLAERTNDQRRLGDKRRTAAIRNLTLGEVMWAELTTGEGKKKFKQIRALLEDFKANPNRHVSDEKTLQALLSQLASYCIDKADAIVCTISNALKPSFINMVSPQINFAIIDEAGKVGHAAFLSLIASYDPVTWVLDGDEKQQGVYFPTHMNRNFWNPFSQHGRRSALTIANEVTKVQVSLMEQHRMHTRSLTSFLTSTFYKDRMLDGNIVKKAKPAEYLMVNDFLSNEYGVEGPDNWIFFYLRDSRSSKQEIGTSTYNVHHQHAVLGIVRRFLRFMAESTREFDKENFTIEVLTPYKAQAQQTSLLLEGLKDKRVQCNTISKVQGVGRNFTILDFTNGQGSTEFSDDPRNTLVGCTRHKHGIIILASEKATIPATYGPAYKYAEQVKHTGKLICTLADFALEEGRFKELPLPNIKDCSRCGQIGHTVTDCELDPSAGEMCHNCMALGHSWSECPDDRTRPDATRKERSVKVRCRRCEKIGHMKVDCPEPYCKKCEETTHNLEDCPNKHCSRCNTNSHWFGERCPKFKKRFCTLCGSTSHNMSNCKTPMNKATLSAQPVGKLDFYVKHDTVGQKMIQGLKKAMTGVATGSASAELETDIEQPSAHLISVKRFWELAAPTTAEQEAIQIDYAIYLSLVQNKSIALQARPKKENRRGKDRAKKELLTNMAKQADTKAKLEIAELTDILELQFLVASFYSVGTEGSYTKLYCLPAQDEAVRAPPDTNVNVLLTLDDDSIAWGWVWLNHKGEQVWSWKINEATFHPYTKTVDCPVVAWTKADPEGNQLVRVPRVHEDGEVEAEGVEEQTDDAVAGGGGSEAAGEPGWDGGAAPTDGDAGWNGGAAPTGGDAGWDGGAAPAVGDAGWDGGAAPGEGW